MTIDEAIRFGAIWVSHIPPHESPSFQEMLQLGIEALEAVKTRQDKFPNLPHLRLPSQTKD